MNKIIIDNIEQYLYDTKEFYKDLIAEIKNKEYKKSESDLENIILYYQNNIVYSINKYEIHCRALRDKLNESEIL